MIISRGRGYIFVHIPKTGGTALALALEARAMADDILVGDTPKARRRRRRLKGVMTVGRLWKHSTLADIEGLVQRDEFAGFFVFTIVRNPWDRMVSYYHWLRAQSFKHPAVHLAGRLDFSGFLNHAQTEAALRANPYGSYLRDSAGREHCDLWLRLEALDDDIPRLEARLGLRLPALEIVNPSERHRDYRRYYNQSDAERVARLCAEDIARFGYRFDAG
jgi:hypothetical protein